MSVPLRLPPPPTNEPCGAHGAENRKIAAAIVCAVKSVTVARMSASESFRSFAAAKMPSTNAAP